MNLSALISTTNTQCCVVGYGIVSVGSTWRQVDNHGGARRKRWWSDISFMQKVFMQHFGDEHKVLNRSRNLGETHVRCSRQEFKSVELILDITEITYTYK